MVIPQKKRRGEAKSAFTPKSIAAIAAPTTRAVSEYSDSIAIGLHLLAYQTGRKVFHMRYTFDSKKCSIKIGEYPATSLAEAREVAYQIRGLLDKGTDPKTYLAAPTSAPTFSEFFENEYLPYAKKHKKSYISDESKYRIRLKSTFGDSLIDEIRHSDINRFLLALNNERSNGTCNRYLMLMRSVFNHARDHGVVTDHPCEKIKQLKEPPGRDHCMTELELSRFREALKEDPNVVAASALELGLETGLRRNEILTATWKNYDSARKTLFLPVTKNGTGRYVPLSDEANDVIQRMARRRQSEFIFYGKDPTKPLNNPTKCLKRILKAAAINPDFCMHSLRHNWASQAVRGGIPLYDIKELLGHANIVSTQRYTHQSQEKLQERANAISKLMKGKKK